MNIIIIAATQIIEIIYSFVDISQVIRTNMSIYRKFVGYGNAIIY